MKLKVKPEDFFVEEHIILPRKKGEYGLYLLEKRGWNTVDVLKKIASTYKIPISHLAAAGRKDKYAVTKQYVTIKRVKGRFFKDKNWELIPVGTMDRPVGPDLIIKNSFRIVLRKVSKEEGEYIKKALSTIKACGLPNYYGDQRFGTYDSQNGFVGEKIVKQQFKGAVKAFLCTIHPGDKKPAKERKRYFFEYFDEPKFCLKQAKTTLEKRIFSFLLKEKNYLRALYLIPAIELEFQLSMFQSYLWNLFLRELLLHLAPEGYEIRGRVNSYYFPSLLSEPSRSYLSREFPTPGYQAKMPDELTQRIYEKILTDNNLKPSAFNFRKFRRHYIKSFPRHGIVFPENFKMGELEPDELYSDHFKLSLSFALPTGSYATILVKNLQAYIAAEKGYH
ncbi:MAG: tRNA pseudouridine(13) synthase TruD [Candidatus Desulfofervidaceae bacterium]|nr:tRNA pseudouridine(13) synthase TruD [Candidatus Desulfofervidaceae bacterium]